MKKDADKLPETDIIQLLESLIDNILFFSTLSWLPFWISTVLYENKCEISTLVHLRFGWGPWCSSI